MWISLNLMMIIILVVMRSVFIPIYCSLPPCIMKEVRTCSWRENPIKCHPEVKIISSMRGVSVPPLLLLCIDWVGNERQQSQWRVGTRMKMSMNMKVR